MRKKLIKRGIPAWIIQFIVILLISYGIYALIRSIKGSLFFLKKDRINVVFYGQQTVFLSLGLSDGVNYQISFSNDLLLQVPGGYGRYKVGALGRLGQLEKNPRLAAKTFSSAASSFVDFYFLPKKTAIYTTPAAGNISLGEPIKILFSTQYQSNASFAERVILLTKLVNKRKRDWTELETEKFAPDGMLAEKAFGDRYKGHFYQKSFRSEAKNIRLVYVKPSAADVLTRIIEGEGIRVVDLERQTDEVSSREKCIIEDDFIQGKMSLTSRYLVRILGCGVRKVGREGDLKLILAPSLEAEWE